MKIEVRISDDIKEPYIIIHTNEITDEINRITELIRAETADNYITATKQDRFFILRPDDIYLVRVENEKTVVYSIDSQYETAKRLYEIEILLGNKFVRISKSTIVNLKFIDYVEPSLGGVMKLFLKNGCNDYISRSFRIS